MHTKYSSLNIDSKSDKRLKLRSETIEDSPILKENDNSNNERKQNESIGDNVLIQSNKR